MELIADVVAFVVRDIIEEWLIEKLLVPLLNGLFTTAGAATIGIGAVGVGTYQYLDVDLANSLDPTPALSETAPIIANTVFVPDAAYYRDQAIRDEYNARVMSAYREQQQQQELMRRRNLTYEIQRQDQARQWRETARQRLLTNVPAQTPMAPAASSMHPLPNLGCQTTLRPTFPFRHIACLPIPPHRRPAMPCRLVNVPA